MKKRRLALLPAIIVVLSLALVLTKPETALHFTTLNNMVKSVVDHEMKYVDIPEEASVEATYEAMIRVDAYMHGHLEVKDYFLINVGVLDYRGKRYPITIGTMKHVYVLITEGQARKVLLRGWSPQRVQQLLKNKKDKASKQVK